MDLNLVEEMVELEILFQQLLLDQQHLLMEKQDQQVGILLVEVQEVNTMEHQELLEIVQVV